MKEREGIRLRLLEIATAHSRYTRRWKNERFIWKVKK